MKYSIRAVFLLILGLAYISFAPLVTAQDAALLPNAVQQFFNNNGDPLTSGTVTTYEAGTSTLKTTWKDSAKSVANTNPIRLDAGGKAIIYGDGEYRQVVKDRNGNLIWDAVTAPGGGGSTPTAVGDGNLVGTVLPWSGLIAPNQYVFAYGQELSRTAYPEFYTATTQLLNVICSNASNTLTGISDTTQIRIGAPVELICMPSGSTVVSKTSASVTLSNPSNISINTTATFFPWGNGNGTTTFNVPDLRGYVMAGRDNMGGTAAARLTTTYYGNNPDALGADGGSQSHTMTISEMVLHTHTATSTVNDPGHRHSMTAAAAAGSGSGGGVTPPVADNGLYTTTNTTGITVSTVNSNTGASSPFTLVQPTITLNYVVKVTPDTSTSIATGVFSIGGMTGVIACGTGILCTGNIISFNGNVLAGGSTNSLQYRNADGSFGGSPNALFISPDTLSLGAIGTTGKFDIYGATSGTVRQTVQAIAGTPTVTWGTSSGTPVVTASAPLSINTTTGNITCSTCLTNTPSALTKVDDTNVTLTLGGTPATALLQAVSITAGWAGQLGLTRGGTNNSLTASNGGVVWSDASKLNILAGTATANLPLLSGSSATPLWAAISYPTSANSGGIPYFSSTTVMASSAALTANQIMVGGGAGSPPTTFACATTTTVVHGGTPPTCSQIVAGNITTNTITNSNLSQTGAATLKGNPTASTANVQDFTIQGLSNLATPSSTLDYLVIYDHTAGTLKSVTPGAIAGSVVAGVASLNTLTGALTITGSNGIVTNSAGTAITITPDTATSSNYFSGTANKLVDSSVIYQAETTTTFNATQTLDFNTFYNTKITLTGNITSFSCSNQKAGQSGAIRFINGAGPYTIPATFGCNMKFAGGTQPTLTATNGAVDVLVYSCSATNYCVGNMIKNVQ